MVSPNRPWGHSATYIFCVQFKDIKVQRLFLSNQSSKVKVLFPTDTTIILAYQSTLLVHWVNNLIANSIVLQMRDDFIMPVNNGLLCHHYLFWYVQWVLMLIWQNKTWTLDLCQLPPLNFWGRKMSTSLASSRILEVNFKVLICLLENNPLHLIKKIENLTYDCVIILE